MLRHAGLSGIVILFKMFEKGSQLGRDVFRLVNGGGIGGRRPV